MINLESSYPSQESGSRRRTYKRVASNASVWCLFNFVGSIVLMRQNKDSSDVDYKDLLSQCGHVEYLILIIHVFWFISLCFSFSFVILYYYRHIIRCIPILGAEVILCGLLSFIWDLVVLWMWWGGKTWTGTHREKDHTITTTALCWEKIRDDAFSVFFLILFNALQYGIGLFVLMVMRIYGCLHFFFPYDQLQNV